jgi:hypothetical protein
LVRPFNVIVLQPLGHEVVKVLGAEDHEVVQALLLNRLNHPFDEGVRVRCPEGCLANVDAAPGQVGLERRRKLCVPVVEQHRDGHLRLGVIQERLGLRSDPRFVRVARRWRDVSAPRLDVQEHQDEHVAQPLCRPNSPVQEVALHERLGVPS